MDGRPFRFGLHFWKLPTDDWVERVRSYQALGFSTITFTDHLVVPQWEPLTALGAIAGVTERIRLGTLVLDMGVRDPVIVAKAAATLEQVSGGRLELGLGAGYVARNFAAAGVPFLAASERIDKLEESIVLLRRLWTESSTTMRGRFYDVVEAPMVAATPVAPKLLVGGGGPKIMHLAGRVADIVSMIPRQPSGDWSVADSLSDSTLACMAQKARWVSAGAESAGRDPDTVELHTMVARTVIGDDIEATLAEEASANGATPEQLADSTLFLLGTGGEARDRLCSWREGTGISYVSFFEPGEEQIVRLAEDVVLPLTVAR